MERLRQNFPVRAEHAGRRVCDGVTILAAAPFPVPVDATQHAALAVLRDAVDAYADLLVADAVHHLVQGRAEVAGAVMDAAAGLGRPPELSLLRTPRHGRAVSSSVLVALPHLDPARPPRRDGATRGPVTGDRARSIDGGGGLAQIGDARCGTSWSARRRRPGPAVTVTLADLGLEPVDALALTRTRLEQRRGRRGCGPAGRRVVGGSGPALYERAARLVGLLGRIPGRGGVSARTAPCFRRELRPIGEGEKQPVGEALATQLRSTSPPRHRRCPRRRTPPDPGAPPGRPRMGYRTRAAIRPPASARTALDLLDARLAAAPDAAAAAQLPRRRSAPRPTRYQSHRPGGPHRGRTGAGHPGLDRAPTSTSSGWASSRRSVPAWPSSRSTSSAPGTVQAWATRAGPLAGRLGPPTERWSRSTPRTALDLAARPAPLAADDLDRFSEVVPDAEQHTGAAFGFSPPPARPSRPSCWRSPPTWRSRSTRHVLAQILVETREPAQARMARPVDLDEQFRALFPAGLLPAAGPPQPAGGTRVIFDVIVRLEADPHQRTWPAAGRPKWPTRCGSWAPSGSWASTRAEDASSPVAVEVTRGRTPIGAVAGQGHLDPATVPAEAIVESEPFDWWTVGRRIRVGRAVGAAAQAHGIAVPDRPALAYRPPVPYDLHRRPAPTGWPCGCGVTLCLDEAWFGAVTPPPASRSTCGTPPS